MKPRHDPECPAGIFWFLGNDPAGPCACGLDELLADAEEEGWAYYPPEKRAEMQRRMTKMVNDAIDAARTRRTN